MDSEQTPAPLPVEPQTVSASDTAAVDIIIVNWNAGDQLASCLRSIAQHGGTQVTRVFVVDNGSTDGSDDIDMPDLPLEIIRTGQNLGFGRACNLAARRCQAPFLLFLNPDAELHAGALAGAVSHALATGDRVGVVGIRLVGRDGVAHRHCARFPDWRSFIGNSLGLTRIARRWFPPVTMIEFDHLETRPIEHVMGAFYLIRRNLFAELGGFDEDFFVYLEDLDLSRRVANTGRETHYLADVTAYHKQGGTSDQVRAHRLFYALQSNIIYAFKHLPRWQAYGVAGVTLLIEPASRLGRAVLRGSVDEVRFTLQGFGMLYRALPNILPVVRRSLAQKSLGSRR
jgi:N-acetylglucosaminyl-diphospho-decaprenol L-rhamnosyltransferase